MRYVQSGLGIDPYLPYKILCLYFCGFPRLRNFCLEVTVAMLTITFGMSRETADFIVDCLELWWQERKTVYAHIRELVINLDNGPEIASHRTQFIKRLVEFADRHDLPIRLVYYPPYHSKYNPIERCWGVLERHWNGTLLNTIETALG
jgi:Rhodopirellula transposase DDE domain